MKTIILLMTSFLMLSPAMAFDQQELDQVESFEQLLSIPEINMDGITARKGGKKINDFLKKRRLVCVSRNGRGRLFKAHGKIRRKVRNRSMRKCMNNSPRPRSCRFLRCRRQGGQFWDFVELVDSLDN